MVERKRRRGAQDSTQAVANMTWRKIDKWHMVSEPERFTIGKAKMGNAHRTYYRYTLAEGDKLIGAYDTAQEAMDVAEAMT